MTENRMQDSQCIGLYHAIRIAFIAYVLMEIWSFEVRALLDLWESNSGIELRALRLVRHIDFPC
jgi:hypothetical protein